MNKFFELLVKTGIATKLFNKIVDKVFKDEQKKEENQEVKIETTVVENLKEPTKVITEVRRTLTFNDGRGGMLYKLGDHPNHPMNGKPVALLSGFYGEADYVALKGSLGELQGEFAGMANPEADGTTLRAHYRWNYELKDIREIIGSKPYSLVVKKGNDVQILDLPLGLRNRQD